MRNKNSRIRHFFLVLYCTKLELDAMLLKNLQRVSAYVYIEHDKCVYDSDLKDNDGNFVHRAGEPEKRHIHLLISFYNGHTFSAVKKLFTTEMDNPRVEPVNDMVSCYEYLTHKNNSEKYQYLESELVFHNEEYYQNLLRNGEKRDNDNIAMLIVKDMLKGTSPLIMIDRYGRDYVIHMRQYKEVVDEIWSFRASHPDESLQKKWDEEIEQMGLY